MSDTQFADINGFRMAYTVEGEGYPLVFAHGLMNSRYAQKEMGLSMEFLLDRFQVITYDARGHGESESPRDVASYNWRQLGRDMHALLDHLGVTEAIIGGASMGCATSLAMVTQFPEKVKGLLLLMPPPFPEPNVDAPEQLTAEMQGVRQMFEMFAAMIEKQGMKGVWPLMQQQPMFQEMNKTNPEMAARMERVMLATNEEGAPLAIRGLITNEPLNVEDFAKLAMPALVVAHGGDPIHPMKSADLLKAKMPHARMHTADSAGHFIQNPDAMLAAIREFLDEVHTS